MWLTAVFPWLARVAASVYYRVEYAGAAVPHRGPVLLVANHPNSLLDPLLVAAAAQRPVRFLGKAPLFIDRKIGWLIKAVGSIPVYRRIDDQTQTERNRDMFRAVEAALGEASAIALFPEGISHSGPSLTPLRTGAARIALGRAASSTASAFPIVPIGLVFRQREVFRSRALVLIGEPVRWDDLASRGVEDKQAVLELTRRIDHALRGVTVNLERWEDQPLVECALEIWEAQRGADPDPAERVARLDVTTRILAEARRTRDPDAAALTREVDAHRRRLRRLRLRPADLAADVTWPRGLSWAAHRVLLVLPHATAAASVGFLLFWAPYHVTGWLVARAKMDEDERSTWKFLVGSVVYTVWVLALTFAAALTIGPWVGLLVLIAAPVVGMEGLKVRERWRGAWDDARRFFMVRTRHPMMDALRIRQRELSTRLDAMVQASSSTVEVPRHESASTTPS